VGHAVRKALTTHEDTAKLFKDVRDMREKLAAQFPGKNRWDLKYAPGGLIDIEFIAQTLQLRDGAGAPQMFQTNTVAALQALETSGALLPNDAATLKEAAHLQHALMQVLRIAIDGTLEPQSATPGLKALLLRASGAADFESLEAKLAALQMRVREVFERVMA
jgi:glutamate-ammonia-ligase adenylyltransferase